MDSSFNYHAYLKPTSVTLPSCLPKLNSATRPVLPQNPGVSFHIRNLTLGHPWPQAQQLAHFYRMLVLLLPTNLSVPLLEVKIGETGEWITHNRPTASYFLKSLYYAKEFLTSCLCVGLC